MAKPQQFDRATVVGQATDLYREKGFHGTSMRTLQEAVNMRPGSIYASFGSKEGLFKEALHNYAQMSQARLDACQSQTDSPITALRLFLQSVIAPCETEQPNGMCMLVKAVSELTEDNAELLSETKTLMRIIEKRFALLVEQAIEKDELSTSQTPQQIARYFQIQLIGLRTYLHASMDDQPASELVDDIFECGPFTLNLKD